VTYINIVGTIIALWLLFCTIEEYDKRLDALEGHPRTPGCFTMSCDEPAQPAPLP
jgi:hypothetical protein